MRAWFSRNLWEDTYELRLGSSAGRYTHAASGIDDKGNIIWSAVDENAPLEPFLRLREDVVEALARALGDVTQASDQTVASLKDAQQVRDRLLVLVEHTIKGETT